MAPPEDLWRIQLPDGRVARCLLVPDRCEYCLILYLGEDIQGFETFENEFLGGTRGGNCGVNLCLDLRLLGNYDRPDPPCQGGTHRCPDTV